MRIPTPGLRFLYLSTGFRRNSLVVSVNNNLKFSKCFSQSYYSSRIFVTRGRRPLLDRAEIKKEFSTCQCLHANCTQSSDFFSSQTPLQKPKISTPDREDQFRKVLKMKPDGVLHNWDLRTYTPTEIQNKSLEIVQRLKSYYDQAESAETVTYENLLKPLIEAQNYFLTMGSIVTFGRHASEDQHIRQASAQAVTALDDATVDMSMRKNIFEKLVEFQGLLEARAVKEDLPAEYKRCLDRLVKNGRRNGLHLSLESREKLKVLKKRMSELSLQYSTNLGEENTELLFKEEELAGMPPSFLETLKKDNETGKYIVTLKYPHFFPIVRKCHIPETRKTLESTYQSKCIVENTRILEELIDLRHQEAKLLGFENHAVFAQELLMAKKPKHVELFLNGLAEKLHPLWEMEKAEMLRLKKENCQKHGYEYDGTIHMYDFRYYTSLIGEKMYDVDQQKLMEYFPLEVVTKGMLEIYEEILSLRFVSLPDADRWNDSVLVYQVNDLISEETLGYIYLDLFPRDGKFTHACCVPLQPGCLNEDGNKQPAVAAMLANFSPPSNGKPSLLDHREVETYFHEFGHLMHTLCCKAKTGMFFGTRVETDFMETPSQMLENWVWEKEPLARMSQHYETKAPIPADMLEKLVASRRALAGGMNLRQIVLATFDQRIHLGEKCDTQATYAEVLKEIMGLEALPGTNTAANFSHLCVGYSGRYYSYLWSEVFSMDMYKSVFKKNGIFNQEWGLKYRKNILEPGGSLDATEMMENFLGRAPTMQAFLESKGLHYVDGNLNGHQLNNHISRS